MNASLEKFRHGTTFLTLLGGRTRQSLGKRRQRAHRRRFARPPRSLKAALVSRAVGAANVLRCTSSLVSRNGNDSTCEPQKRLRVREISRRIFWGAARG